eukprot:3588817-Alexandrium_andersonii.AAC.1
MDHYAGSGYAAAQDIIRSWNLFLADAPEFEERFSEWCAAKHEAWEKQRMKQVNALVGNIENAGRDTRVVQRLSLIHI